MRGPLFQSVCGFGSIQASGQTDTRQERERAEADLASSLNIMAASTNSPRHFFQLGGGADLYRPRMMSSSWVVVTGKMDESSGGTQRLMASGDRGDWGDIRISKPLLNGSGSARRQSTRERTGLHRSGST